jgi:cell wall-associated NlpC family hydrolase
MVVRKTASKALLTLAPYLVPVLIVVLIIAAVVTVIAVAATAAGAQYSGADAKAQKAALAAGLPADQLGSVRAVANSNGIPWQILAALHTAGGSTAAMNIPLRSTLSGVTPDDTKKYAQQLLTSPNVTIQQTATRTGLADTAAGRPVVNSCNEPMVLSPLLLGALAELTASKWKITIDDFGFPGDRGYCETGTYQHPKGNAVDLQGLVNLQTNQATSPGLDGYPGDDPVVVSAFATDFLAALPAQADGTRAHGGVGQKQCGVKPTFPADSQNVYTFDDSCDHLHVDVRNRTDLMESALTGYTGLSGGAASPASTTTRSTTPTITANPTATRAASATPTVSTSAAPSTAAGKTLTLDPGSELVRARFGSDTPRPTQVDQFLGGLLAVDMAASYGAGRMKTLTDGTIQSTDGVTLLTFPADMADQVAAQKQAWVAAIARLPIEGNSNTYAFAAYDEALRLALVPLSECPTGAGVMGIVGGGLSAQAVPEPMRSQMILAGQAYGVPPSVVAALYLTENNGFSFAYAYYDGGSNPSAFQLTTSSPEWKLATYGTTGLWPAGGTFRGPFQFGPIWESTYRTPEHPNVLLFADASFGAAHYMADLGAKDNPSDDTINKAAQSYNGQISWSPGGSSIRNPDTGKFSVVKELYAFQVVQLAESLSDGSTGSATATGGGTATPTRATPTTPAGGTTPTAITPTSTAAATPKATATSASAATGCDDPNVAEAARAKAIKASTDGMAKGLVAGLQTLGLPYVWGGGGNGSGPNDGCVRGGGAKNSCRGLRGFDCSGLTAFVLGQAGYLGVPGTSGAQRAGGTGVPWDQSLPGDIIGYPGHVAIYLGVIDGTKYMLEAPQIGENVRVVPVRGGADDMLRRYWA